MFLSIVSIYQETEKLDIFDTLSLVLVSRSTKIP